LAEACLAAFNSFIALAKGSIKAFLKKAICFSPFLPLPKKLYSNPAKS